MSDWNWAGIPAVPLRERADVALSQAENGGIRRHSISSRAAADTGVVLSRKEAAADTVVIPRLEVPLDLKPRSLAIPSTVSPKAGDVVEAAPQGHVPEIGEHTNRLVVGQ